MSRIAATFDDLKARGHLAFMPFVTAGDPDVLTTQRLIRTLTAETVDLIEVGFPYSDPVADGPVVQSSYNRALKRRVTVQQIFEAIGDMHAEPLPPLLAMVSYAIVFRHGVDAFLEDAARAGFSGLIVPDLPGDEAAEVFESVRASGLDLVQLIAPTTPRERARSILGHCSGFVYCVAAAGTTGEREQVAGQLIAQLHWLREETDLPLAVGFGISSPRHVDPLRPAADGVIVGSAIVRYLQQLADGEPIESVLAAVGQLAREMSAAAHAGTG